MVGSEVQEVDVRKRCKSWVVLLGAGMATMLAFGYSARAQTSQMLKIPDTAPRELEPRLRLHEDPAMPETTRKMLAAQQEKRRQLIVWAANELVVLSERADHAASAPPGDAAKTELAGDVNKIEALAKNLALALRAK